MKKERKRQAKTIQWNTITLTIMLQLRMVYKSGFIQSCFNDIIQRPYNNNRINT